MTKNSDHLQSNRINLAWLLRCTDIGNDTHGHGSSLEDSFVVVNGGDDFDLLKESLRSLNSEAYYRKIPQCRLLVVDVIWIRSHFAR